LLMGTRRVGDGHDSKSISS